MNIPNWYKQKGDKCSNRALEYRSAIGRCKELISISKSPFTTLWSNKKINDLEEAAIHWENKAKYYYILANASWWKRFLSMFKRDHSL